MAASSLRHHIERAHGRVLPQVRGVDVRGGGLEVYKVSFPWILKSVDCLVEGCPDKAKSPGRLRENLCFVIINQMWPSCRRHWNHYRSMISSGCICRCIECLNVVSWKSSINQRIDGSGGGICRWRKGVSKCSST